MTRSISIAALAAALSLAPVAALADDCDTAQSAQSTYEYAAPTGGTGGHVYTRDCDNIINCAVLAAHCDTVNGQWTQHGEGAMGRPNEATCVYEG